MRAGQSFRKAVIMSYRVSVTNGPVLVPKAGGTIPSSPE